MMKNVFGNLLNPSGIIWNSLHGAIHTTGQKTGRKSSSIDASIDNFVKQTFFVSAREMSSFTGKIISAGAVFSNVSRIMTRHCAISVAAAADWNTKFASDNYCIREIQFWKSNLHRLHTKNIDLAPITSNYVIYSNASATGCGAHIDLNGTQVCHKQWNEEECKKRSTWRELSAIEFALESFFPIVQGSYIKWFSDNQAACSIVQVGSMRHDLHITAINIFNLCATNNIELEIQWISRNELQKADFFK